MVPNLLTYNSVEPGPSERVLVKSDAPKLVVKSARWTTYGMPVHFKQTRVVIRIIFGTVLLAFSLAAAANAQSHRWRSFETRKLITFDFNCAETSSFPKASLNKIVQRAIKAEDVGLPTDGDRAFAFPLEKHSAPVYFVPTACGATGNCAWRLYRIKPVKYLGKINGQLIYTYQSPHGLPTIVTYGNSSATEGGLSTYITNHGEYRPLRGEYRVDEQNLNGHPMPQFFKRAKPQCKDYGG